MLFYVVVCVYFLGGEGGSCTDVWHGDFKEFNKLFDWYYWQLSWGLYI